MESPYIARVQMIDNMPPARGYLWREGLLEKYGTVSGAAEHLSELLREQPEFMKDVDFLLPILWADDEKTVVEVFGYINDSESWPGNGEVYSWVFKNGVYIPDERNIACATTIRLLGREEEYRQATSSLYEYMKNPPRLGNLEPNTHITINEDDIDLLSGEDFNIPPSQN